MTNQFSYTIENWKSMSVADRLSAVDDLVFYADTNHKALQILHELFFQEINGDGDAEVMDALVSAITRLMDPKLAEQLNDQISKTLGFDVSKLLGINQSKTKITNDQDSAGTASATKKCHTRKTRKKIANDQAQENHSDVDVFQEDLKQDGKKLTSTAAKTREDKKTLEKQKSDDKSPKLVQETVLELVENEKGAMVLREVGQTDALVSIEFSKQVKDMLGVDMRVVGQAMIQAAIASVVQRQANFWHANVFDEEPVHYS